MDYDGGFILQKDVNWSLLNDRMTILVRCTRCSHPTTSTTFTRSQNNDSTNIIIISPRSSFARLLPSGRKNYHRIIHKNTPRFNRKKFQFEFENNEVLRLNYMIT